METMRVLVMIMAILCFAGIVFWAYSPYSRKSFHEAEQLPFIGDDDPIDR